MISITILDSSFYSLTKLVYDLKLSICIIMFATRLWKPVPLTLRNIDSFFTPNSIISVQRDKYLNEIHSKKKRKQANSRFKARCSVLNDDESKFLNQDFFLLLKDSRLVTWWKMIFFFIIITKQVCWVRISNS